MNLKEYLEVTGMTGYALAKLSKISYESIYRFTRGYKPSKRLAAKLEKATHGKLTVHSLTCGKLKTLKGEYKKKQPAPRVCVKCNANFVDKRPIRLCPVCDKHLLQQTKSSLGKT